MKNKKVNIIILLIICVALFTACNKFQTTPELEEIEMPKALFLYNFEYVDKKRIVSYIDEIGDVYSIELSSEERDLKLKEVNEKLDSSKDKKIGHVDKEQLKKMYQKFLQVPIESGEEENLIFIQDEEDDEKGYHEWYGFRYNKQGEIEYVLLNGDGDYGYKNQNETAQEIADWLKDDIVEYNIYGDLVVSHFDRK